MPNRHLFAATKILVVLAVGWLTCNGSWRETFAQDRSTAPTLPYPDQEFRGETGRTTAASKSDFPQAFSAPKGAPNNLLVMTDDVGFAASSTFGGAKGEVGGGGACTLFVENRVVAESKMRRPFPFPIRSTQHST